mgnify:CR=1 FL=1
MLLRALRVLRGGRMLNLGALGGEKVGKHFYHEGEDHEGIHSGINSHSASSCTSCASWWNNTMSLFAVNHIGSY